MHGDTTKGFHYHVCWILVNIGSFANIITPEFLKKLSYSKKDLEAVEVLIVGFGGRATYSLGTKRLPVRVRDKESLKAIETNFLIVDILRAYNVILGCLTLDTIKVITASYLLHIEFKLDGGRVKKFYGNQKMVREYYYINLKSLERKKESLLSETSRQNKLR